MLAFDASSIHAWDNYPIIQFPGLWDWMASQIAEKQQRIIHFCVNCSSHSAPEGRGLLLRVLF